MSPNSDETTDGHLHDLLTIQSQTENLCLVREFVARTIDASRLPIPLHNRIILAVDEAISNIIEHGYESDRNGRIEIEVDSSLTRYTVAIRDSGRSFHPEQIETIDIQNHVRKGRRNGLGIYIMRQIMDEVEYTFKEGIENELRLVKYIP